MSGASRGRALLHGLGVGWPRSQLCGYRVTPLIGYDKASGDREGGRCELGTAARRTQRPVSPFLAFGRTPF